MNKKRYVPVTRYCKDNDISYKTVMYGLETGQIPGIKTESGQWRVDTQGGENHDLRAVLERLEAQGRLLNVLCQHLGVKMGG